MLPKWAHQQIHKHLIYIQEKMCYKSVEGALLDTKEKHLKYISKAFGLDNE